MPIEPGSQMVVHFVQFESDLNRLRMTTSQAVECNLIDCSNSLQILSLLSLAWLVSDRLLNTDSFDDCPLLYFPEHRLTQPMASIQSISIHLHLRLHSHPCHIHCHRHCSHLGRGLRPGLRLCLGHHHRIHRLHQSSPSCRRRRRRQSCSP